jgi:hypothetical protein
MTDALPPPTAPQPPERWEHPADFESQDSFLLALRLRFALFLRRLENSALDRRFDRPAAVSLHGPLSGSGSGVAETGFFPVRAGRRSDRGSRVRARQWFGPARSGVVVVVNRCGWFGQVLVVRTFLIRRSGSCGFERC